MSNERLRQEEVEKRVINNSLALRSTLRSLFKDHCFNESLSIKLRNELYRLCDLSIPEDMDEKKKWIVQIRRFIVKLRPKVRKIKKKSKAEVRAPVKNI